MKLFVGLDVALAKTAVCVISEHGRIMKETQIASEPEELVRFALDLDGTIAAVGLEAGPLSQWLHLGLSEAGLEGVLMETRQVKGAAAMVADRSRPIGATPRELPAFSISGGFGRSIASLSRPRRSVPSLAHARPSSRA